MYPLNDNSLSLGEIAHHWIRNLPQQPPEDEVLTVLLQAFWRGEFEPFATLPEQRFSRHDALIAVRGAQPHRRIAFRDDTAGDAYEATPTPKGGLTVDLRAWINLPSDESRWDHSVLEQAYQRLATCELDAYSSDALAGFRVQRLERERFGEFCDRSGWPRPAFWFGRHRSEEPVQVEEEPLRPSPGPGGRARGAPAKYDYALIDKELEKLLRKAGRQRFPRTAKVMQYLANELGTDALPGGLPHHRPAGGNTYHAKRQLR